METRQAQRRRWGRSEEQRLAWLRKALRRPGAKLVLEHLAMHGHRFAIVPGGLRVTQKKRRCWSGADTSASTIADCSTMHLNPGPATNSQ